MIVAAAADGIGRIRLDAPERHNALTQGAMRDLSALLDRWADDGVKALSLTGTGRSFCAGASLDELDSADWADNPLTALCDRLQDFPAPTLALLNGGVYGGGVELAAACDMRIGVDGMRAFVPAAELGIHYSPEGMARVRRIIGPQATRRLFLLAERFDDAALAATGFVDRLVSQADLDRAGEDWLAHAVTLAPLAVRGMKESLNALDRGVDDPDAPARIRAAFSSEDHAEARAARREKRPPRFTGR
ncbi:enoyl-CoA hydratase/isomerase family protein [Oceanomicrobium pacificus]|uniref:Enoyl-CoA hydratase/isomerase family protein n=1 Tax=Oceanomicrobium pacificus TaxID=2692916 RepID=A0A6B0TV43_9RHOB|nr:enoyl-CoA hydratase-related protein [Oceanomicrobium pacificus]MXU64823.1 enoyl-CoA hydratase/isomerase family protein [Oceanomicrobium pacificus]